MLCFALAIALVSCAGYDINSPSDTAAQDDGTEELTAEETTAPADTDDAETQGKAEETTAPADTESVETQGEAEETTAPADTEGAETQGEADETESTTEPPDNCEDGHDEVLHPAKAVTCTEAGWNAYVSCTRCDYNTKVEIPAGHDEVPHTAKEATCTEAGWNAYVSCTRCDYNTKVEIPAGHDEVLHPAKAVTCTEAGWNAYVTCTRCDYINREVIKKCAHDYGADGKCSCGAEEWKIPQGMTTHYATDLSENTPTIDGIISAGEYGEALHVEAPRVIDLDRRQWLDSAIKEELASKYMDFYFSYDEDNIYIAIYDVGPDYINNNDGYSKNDVAFRHNYRFEFGFDLEKTDSYFMFEGGSTSTAWDDLVCYKNGSREQHSLMSYNLVSESIIQKFKIDERGNLGDYIAYGEVGVGNGNENYTNGEWAVVMEFKLNKNELVDVINEVYGTEYEELSNAMWLSVTAKGYKAKQNNLDDTVATQNVRWIGKNNNFVDLIVFGDEDTEIVVADPAPTQSFCPDGHLLTLHKAKAPTYDEAGYEAYEECDRCDYTTYSELPKIEKVFKTGYARVDITPNVSVQNPLGQFTNVMDNIYATCVAVSDGEKTIIMLSVDMKSMSTGICDEIRRRISKETGVPTDLIFISATHDHSIIEFGNDKKWALDSFRKMGDAAKAAIADLEDTEMFIGTGKTTGMAWVRRYVNGNGSYSSVNPGNLWDTSTRSVSDADDTVQVVRMAREDKKDIILINWQGHLAHAVNHFDSSISADMAHYIREDVEAGDDDALVAFFAGASGNLNLNAPNSSLVKYSNSSNPTTRNNYYVNVAKALAEVVLDTIKDENLTEIEGGRIVFEKAVYAGKHKHDSAAEVAAAQARLNAGGNDPGDRYMVARNRNDYTSLRISAVAFGDFAFITVPYEMFDNNGMQVKEASPFKMTFVLTNSDGDYAYMPSYEAWTEYGGYETEATYFDVGVAEGVVAQYNDMLGRLYDSY